MTCAPSILYSSTQRYRPVLAAARAFGVDVEALLRALGMSEAEILSPDTRVPRERVVAATRQLLALSVPPELGVVSAGNFELRDIGVLGYLLRHSEHPLSAVQRLARYIRLIADAAQCSVSLERGEVVVSLTLSGERTLSPLGVDYAVGMLVRIVSLLSDGRVRPLSVRLPRPRPPKLAPYRQLFGASLSFGSGRAVIRYPEDAFRLPCPEHDPQLAAILERHAELLLSQLPAPVGLLEQLRSIVAQQLEAGEASAHSAAKRLGMSERSLRRKLAEHGSSYRGLLDEVRRERAVALLKEGTVNVSTVAQRVGFADATAFARTFRRWTGCSPSAFARSGEPG